jgi:hypothetical protein
MGNKDLSGQAPRPSALAAPLLGEWLDRTLSLSSDAPTVLFHQLAKISQHVFKSKTTSASCPRTKHNAVELMTFSRNVDVRTSFLCHASKLTLEGQTRQQVEHVREAYCDINFARTNWIEMTYESIDKLQKVLVKRVFHYAKDSKKAAGRALGTLVEVITFYTLKAWGFEHSLAIERSLAEYGNPEITHNVEYSLHPILRQQRLKLANKLPLSSARILASVDERKFPLSGFQKSSNVLLTNSGVLRNSCVVANGDMSHIVAALDLMGHDAVQLGIIEQYSKPYAIFECKRVGVEEGMKKGPQTIEKAKQGAYVAKSLSSLHKLRTSSGDLHGLIYKNNQTIYSKPYAELVAEIVASNDAELLQDFVLTVGVVSNHGNWFTSDNHNKELKVLAQSYDWLLFLTDQGLSEFITELLLNPEPLLAPARNAFLSSYTKEKTKNQFTKVQMDYGADQVLQEYFRANAGRIEKWFNVIGPAGNTIKMLKAELSELRKKDWRRVHAL